MTTLTQEFIKKQGWLGLKVNGEESPKEKAILHYTGFRNMIELRK